MSTINPLIPPPDRVFIKIYYMKAKIIGFTKFPDGQDKDCICITDKGEEIIIDPFVGCSWEYEKREHLLNEWVEDKTGWIHESGVYLTGDDFRIIHRNSDSV